MAMKMHDTSIKRKELWGGIPVAGGKAQDEEIVHPHIELLEKQFPDLKGQEHGDTLTTVCEWRIRRKESSDEHKKPEYGLELLRIGLKGKVSAGDFKKMPEGEKTNHMRKSVGLTAEEE